MQKKADSQFPLMNEISHRWSPRAFADRDLDRKTMGSLFEAARWAPSCFNDQPWRFVVATRKDEEAFERLGSCLMDGNSWAKKASLLVLTVARKTFERNDKPNRHAWHDVGLAVENLVLQAQSMGLVCHQMAGFHSDKSIDTFEIPDGFEPVTMIAVGYPGTPSTLPDDLRSREESRRARKPLEEIVFFNGWEKPHSFGD